MQLPFPKTAVSFAHQVFSNKLDRGSQQRATQVRSGDAAHEVYGVPYNEALGSLGCKVIFPHHSSGGPNEGILSMDVVPNLALQSVKADGKGAIAAHLYHQMLLGEIVRWTPRPTRRRRPRLPIRYTESGIFPEAFVLYHLLGDPALGFW
jgi:hypothetical protein